MGRHEDYPIPPNPNLYPEELQLKLYQAFIFSIPILFSIILFLLFYLFYLKRRANTSSSQLPTTRSSPSNHSSFLSPPWNLGIKGEIKDKLHVVLFDEELRARDSLCCVCLGEFEMKEELRQLPLCKHVFHGDCIRHWLRANATCPLCRCPVMTAIKMGHPVGLGPGPGPGLDPTRQGNAGSSSNTNISISPSRPEEHAIQIAQEPSSSTTHSS